MWHKTCSVKDAMAVCLLGEL